MLDHEIERSIPNDQKIENSDRPIICDACGGDYPVCADDCPLKETK